MSFKRDIQTSLKGTYRSVVLFMIINVGIFLISNILIHLVIIGGDKDTSAAIMYDALAVNSDFMGFLPRFWTLFTYMFVHVELRHIVSNMLWLWFLGRIFCELLGSKRMVTAYLLGGLSGGILYLIFTAIAPPNHSVYLLGASGAVMSIVVAVAAASPEYRVFPFGIAMKLKWLAFIAVALTTLIDLSVNTGGKVAHIGGAVFGLLYGYSIRKGNLFGSMKNPFARKAKLRVAHKRGTDADYNIIKTTVRKRVDEILDKISRSGYDSLTREEKEFLQKNHDKL